VVRCLLSLKVVIEVLDGWQDLLVEFSDEIFNALVEKLEILSPTHFLLKSGMREEKNIYRRVSTIITMDIYRGLRGFEALMLQLEVIDRWVDCDKRWFWPGKKRPYWRLS
jgi:hypothetical protein